MKTKCSILLVAAVAAVAFVGCTSDDDVTPTGVKQSLTFVATADGGAHKSGANDRMFTQLHPDDNNSVTFCKDDTISVFSDGTNNKFTTADNGASVEFNGKATQTANYYALYPYQEGATISGDVISATLPATQTAQTGAPYFDPQAALSVATTTDEDRKFYFYNVGGLVKVTTKEALQKLVFRGNNSETVAGTVSITVGDEPSYTGANATSVTLRPAEEGTTIPAGTYYFVVLPQTFTTGFTIEAYQEGNTTDTPNYTRAFGGKITLPRSRVLNVGEMKSPFNGHAYVDLGIEVDGYKVLWATTNVGATTPEGYGDYFAWGETTPKTNYAWGTYAWGSSASSMTKYTGTDGKTVLDLADDAAHVNWGGDWVMPTQAEWGALCNTNNCLCEWTTLNNVKGRKFTSKINGNSIFLPAADVYSGTSLYQPVGSRGYYWSSSLYTDVQGGACNLRFLQGNVYGAMSEYSSCFYGEPVRPVIRMAK